MCTEPCRASAAKRGAERAELRRGRTWLKGERLSDAIIARWWLRVGPLADPPLAEGDEPEGREEGAGAREREPEGRS